MCTKSETKDAVREVLHEQNDDGETMIGKEVNRHVDKRFNELIRYMNMRFAIPALITAFIFGGLWYTLQGRITSVEKVLDEGGRYTEDDAIEDNRLQEGRDARQDAEIQALREETSNQFRTINSKLDRLTEYLIR